MNQTLLYTGVHAGIQLYTGTALVVSAVLTAAAADATATLYDNTSAAGNPLAVIACKAGTTYQVKLEDYTLKTGIWAVVTGSGAQLNAFVR